MKTATIDAERVGRGAEDQREQPGPDDLQRQGREAGDAERGRGERGLGRDDRWRSRDADSALRVLADPALALRASLRAQHPRSRPSWESRRCRCSAAGDPPGAGGGDDVQARRRPTSPRQAEEGSSTKPAGSAPIAAPTVLAA